ncbi:MAG: hypothetical protein HKP59_12130 [Lutibacter sp.]|uniref:hypothetical protein n=1 Tax=Lutibacter sp. TaxID=1925666 RepID=UPI0017D293A4|nr:hypothetical protein [Lutibacter sp.]MBT8318361.1 hypothetical protein [Lutibacter sp.]NNJ59219.1 hypothetical protein [Lutibacter sp.]
MHKKLKAQLVSLAHSILEMKNSDDIVELHNKSQELYEKLTVLKFVDSNMNNVAENEVFSKEIVGKIEPIKESIEKDITAISFPSSDEMSPKKVISQEQVEEIFGIEDTLSKNDEHDIPSIQSTLEEELKDAISSDVATELFERVTKENPVVEEIPESYKKSLNDTLFKNNLQVELNDRIAFVKHLFEGDQGDFNRVLSQLNTFKSENEAKTFIKKMVKPDYDWSTKQEYEERLISLIERKFL